MPRVGAASSDFYCRYRECRHRCTQVACAVAAVTGRDGDQLRSRELCGDAVVAIVKPVDLRDRDDVPSGWR